MHRGVAGFKGGFFLAMGFETGEGEDLGGSTGSLQPDGEMRLEAGEAGFGLLERDGMGRRHVVAFELSNLNSLGVDHRW